MTSCRVEGCHRTYKAKGLCRTHYGRVRRGIPLERPVAPPGSGRPREDEGARFVSRIAFSDGCWLWTGSVARTYGQFALAGGRKMVKAHRYSWERVNGPTPSGLTLHHLCHVRLCVRPDHMVPITRSEHTRIHNAERNVA